jgi:hypothetical protein
VWRWLATAFDNYSNATHKALASLRIILNLLPFPLTFLPLKTFGGVYLVRQIGDIIQLEGDLLTIAVASITGARGGIERLGNAYWKQPLSTQQSKLCRSLSMERKSI